MSEISTDSLPGTTAFISYAREDKEFRVEMCKGLEAHGVVPVGDWFLTPGQDYQQRLKELNLSSQAFVFVISPDSLKSEACMNELTLAVEHKKQILPVSHRDHGDDKRLDSALRAPQWTFLRQGDNFETGIAGLVEAVNTDFDLMKTHGRLLLAAENWKNSGRNRSHLLRKDGLKEAEAWLAKTSAQPGKMPQPTALEVEYIFSGRRARSRASRIALGIVAAVALSLTLLTIVAFAQRSSAVRYANEAQVQATIAKENEAKAVNNAREAEQQRLRAEDSAREAKRQQQKAEDNLAEAKRQQAIAKANEVKANRNAAEARRQQRAAEENAKRAVEVGKRRLVVATLLLNPEGMKFDSVYSAGRDLSYGVRPWTLKNGGLKDLLKGFESEQPEAFVRILGGGDAAIAQRLLDYVATPTKDAVPLDDIFVGVNRKPSDKEPPEEVPVTDDEDENYDPQVLKNWKRHADRNLPEGNLNREPWLTRFQKAGQEPALQAVQLKAHTDMYLGFMDELRVLAPEIKTERGVAFMLDLALYRGTNMAKKILSEARQSGPRLNEPELLRRIAEISASSSPQGTIAAWTQRRHQMFLTTPFLSDKVLGF
jgi:hypothetical protein